MRELPELQVDREVLSLEVARTDPGFRTVLSSPVYPYDILTAPRGFLIPFRLPRYVGWVCPHLLAAQAPRCVFNLQYDTQGPQGLA